MDYKKKKKCPLDRHSPLSLSLISGRWVGVKKNTPLPPGSKRRSGCSWVHFGPHNHVKELLRSLSPSSNRASNSFSIITTIQGTPTKWWVWWWTLRVFALILEMTLKHMPLSLTDLDWESLCLAWKCSRTRTGKDSTFVPMCGFLISREQSLGEVHRERPTLWSWVCGHLDAHGDMIAF